MIIAKGFLKSKTIWLGTLNVAVAVLEFLTSQPLVEQYWEYIIMANGVLMIILRFLTTQPVASTPLQDQRVPAPEA